MAGFLDVGMFCPRGGGGGGRARYSYTLSTSFIELVNIDESSHKNSIRIFITKKLKKTKHSCVTEDDNGKCFDIFYSKYIYIMILIYSWYLGG